MKKVFLLLLAILFIGCATQPEIRYYKSYNRSSEFKSFIQGDSYRLWYDEKIHSQFIEFEKDSAEWKSAQKKMGAFPLDHVFHNRESDIVFGIGRIKYKASYDKMLKRSKEASEAQNLTIIESDQRMVNNTPVLYVRFLGKEDGTNMMGIVYFIHYNSGTVMFITACPEGVYWEHREKIKEAMNGIEIQ